LQNKCDLLNAEELFRGFFWTDVRPMVREWRESKGLPVDPLAELARSGYVEEAARNRGAQNAGLLTTYA